MFTGVLLYVLDMFHLVLLIVRRVSTPSRGPHT